LLPEACNDERVLGENSPRVAHLVEINAHAFELELGGAVVDTIAVETMLARDGLPERSTNLVTALTGLEVNLDENEMLVIAFSEVKTCCHGVAWNVDIPAVDHSRRGKKSGASPERVVRGHWSNSQSHACLLCCWKGEWTSKGVLGR
jgi:hypothetical protein